ncbi:MAG: hypothetical protein CMM52_09485 [Rhodospirillaceae bacterium]|nr:hypothetical protein [Rhodospirillaceae bacterium]
MLIKTGAVLLIGFLSILSFGVFAQSPSFTKGPGEITNKGLYQCKSSFGWSRGRVSAVGKITSEDGKEWIVPAETHFLTARKAPDLHNVCTGTTPGSLAEVDRSRIPVFDAGGLEEFVAYIFADNYFELFVNGKLIAVDPVPFSPFNSSVVRFKAKRPVTVAFKLVDSEENLGVGTESSWGSDHHPGDGGLVAHFKDKSGKTVLLTDDSWRAQTFYTAPLKDRSCLKVIGNRRDSSACDTEAADDGTQISGAHWAIPMNWMKAEFDDSNWPNAVTFTNQTVGVGNKRSYTSFTDVFDTPGADALFIWSSNLILDNLVLFRKVLE